MKRKLPFILLEILIPVLLYTILLHLLAGTNIIAGIFCPGPHLPQYYPVLILLFLLSRLYIVLLPGILLGRIGCLWLKQRLR